MRMCRVLFSYTTVVLVIFAWNASGVFAVPPGAGTILSQERQEITQKKIRDMKTDPPEDVIDEIEETSELTRSDDGNTPESESKKDRKEKIKNK